MERKIDTLARVVKDSIDRLGDRLENIERLLHQTVINTRKIMATLDDVVSDVAAQGTVIDSAVALLKGLKTALDAAGTDPAKLDALKASIDSQSQALADAVAANTPAASPPTT